MQIWNYISLGCALLLMAGGFVLRRRAARKMKAMEAPTKGARLSRRLFGLMNLAGAWWFVVKLLSLLYGSKENAVKKEFEVDIFPARWEHVFFGRPVSISSTVLTTWGIIAVVLALALVFRIFIVPRMQQNPKGVQLALETAIEKLDQYIGTKLHGMSISFGAYIFSTALLLVASAMVELLGLHAPTADITMTLALALITFFLINFYGFKRKGLFGRIKSLGSIKDPDIPAEAGFGEKIKLHLKSVAQPSTIGFPFRVISDLVVPLSLTCRLFGNMFGGMIIIDLLYYAMGSRAVAVPSVAGLYFNIFHPLIQAFIFITLTLSYIEEATAAEE